MKLENESGDEAEEISMIVIKNMKIEDVTKLKEIDRSEYIELIYKVNDGELTEILDNSHECPNWTDEILKEIEERFIYELKNGGLALGAYDQEKLVGFGVLAHKFRGESDNQLQIDLMYVSRGYRRKGIGTRIFQEISIEAKSRGAKYLYISSTETRSAVSFYKNNGSRLTQQVDIELFEKEPNDIHMLKELL